MRRRLAAFFDRLFPDPAKQLASSLAEASRREHEARTAAREKASTEATIRHLSEELVATKAMAGEWRSLEEERVSEFREAQMMAGAGPWVLAESRRIENPGSVGLRETTPISAQGAYGDIDLALQNLEWRREINLSWLEFSRWGIQQIILISRLYYIKNPIVRRLVDVCASYVFARGVEVTSDDEAAAEILEEFFKRNQKTLGQIALVDLERRKDYDGNLFFAFFVDKVDKGQVSVRTIDATEIMDIVTNPDDTDDPWLYHRCWTERAFDMKNGQANTTSREAWYPALSYVPTEKPESINGKPVKWDIPVYHRKAGAVAKWHFGCPRIYPMLDWAKASKRFLEACATVKQSLAQIAMTLTTKGGQQALEGAKQQLQTSAGPSSALWDQNPTPVNASIFASGPGTQLEAFNTKGGGGDPEEVRQFKLMCCMVKGVPETFLGDVSTGNLATATSLDRPTETVMLELQEQWIEDLGIIGTFVLAVSAKAPSGKLREAKAGKQVTIREARRVRAPDGRMVYEAKKATDVEIEVKVNFPSIREGDVPALVAATVSAIQNGKLDPKVGVRQLCDLLPGIEDADAIVAEMWPDRQNNLTSGPYVAPEPPVDPAAQPTEAARKIARRLITEVMQERNGHAHTAGHART